MCATLLHLCSKACPCNSAENRKGQGTERRRTQHSFTKSDELLEQRCGSFSPRRVRRALEDVQLLLATPLPTVKASPGKAYAPGLCRGMGIVKHHLSLPESAWLGLLLDNSWGPDCHQSGLGMKTGKNKSIELEMKGGGAIPSTLE